MASGPLTIGDLAKATATKIETIRYYERIGLLSAPARTGGNYRAFTAQHLGRLSFIRRARDLGFTPEQVRVLLGLSDQQDRPCDAVDALARQHLAEVDRKISDLRLLHKSGNNDQLRINDARSSKVRKHADVAIEASCCADIWCASCAVEFERA